MPALCRRVAASTCLLRRYNRCHASAPKLLWRERGMLLLQRRIGLARRNVPVLSEQVGPHAESLAGEFAHERNEIGCGFFFVGRVGICCVSF